MGMRSSPEGDRGLRPFPLPPCRARRREIPCFRERATMVARPAIRSRPSGATQHRCWVEQLGGAPAGARSYWQGRFAACAFVERVWHTGRPRNSWGVAPNPTRELRPLTPQGEIFPLTPFARLSWFLYHTPSACCALGVLPTITPRALPLPPPHPSPDSAGTARLPPDAGRDASSRYHRPAPHGLPSPPSRLPSPRGSRFPSRRPCR